MEFQVRPLPFQHILIAPVFPTAFELGCLTLLETCSWEKRADDFYRFDVPTSDSIKERLVQLIGTTSSEKLRRALETNFSCQLATAVQLEVHRYLPGSGIGPHTDAKLPEVRLVASYNRSWRPEAGGVWILAEDSSLELNRTFLPSISNTGFAFATSTNSYHALSICREGIYYGLTLRFQRQA
jgi:hypothetical protein